MSLTYPPRPTEEPKVSDFIRQAADDFTTRVVLSDPGELSVREAKTMLYARQGDDSLLVFLNVGTARQIAARLVEIADEADKLNGERLQADDAEWNQARAAAVLPTWNG